LVVANARSEAQTSPIGRRSAGADPPQNVGTCEINSNRGSFDHCEFDVKPRCDNLVYMQLHGTGVGFFATRADAARSALSGSCRSGTVDPEPSGPGMRLPVHGAEPFRGDVGVQLGGRQARVTEQFLDGAKIGTAFQ
jgi:hypothetical protein